MAILFLQKIIQTRYCRLRCRLTSKLYKALSKGLIDFGLEVKSIGICPTPMLYFADYHLKTVCYYDNGSHNPSEYNGFKMVLNKHSFFSENIQNQNIVLNYKLEKKKILTY